MPGGGDALATVHSGQSQAATGQHDGSALLQPGLTCTGRTETLLSSGARHRTWANFDRRHSSPRARSDKMLTVRKLRLVERKRLPCEPAATAWERSQWPKPAIADCRFRWPALHAHRRGTASRRQGQLATPSRALKGARSWPPRAPTRRIAASGSSSRRRSGLQTSRRAGSRAASGLAARAGSLGRPLATLRSRRESSPSQLCARSRRSARAQDTLGGRIARQAARAPYGRRTSRVERVALGCTRRRSGEGSHTL